MLNVLPSNHHIAVAHDFIGPFLVNAFNYLLGIKGNKRERERHMLTN